MKLEDQVCSLELAKRLKELGVKQESLFWWVHSSWAEPWELGYQGDFPGAGTQEEDYSAFTVAELGEMLPEQITHLVHNEAVHSKNNFYKGVDGRWSAQYSFLETKYADTEADARANMLIYLIEQEMVKP